MLLMGPPIISHFTSGFTETKVIHLRSDNPKKHSCGNICWGFWRISEIASAGEFVPHSLPRHVVTWVVTLTTGDAVQTQAKEERHPTLSWILFQEAAPLGKAWEIRIEGLQKTPLWN